MQAGTLAALVRGIGFYALWVLLIGTDHRVIGVATAMAATWCSLHLLPPAPLHLEFARLPGYVLRILGQSFAAGWDIAWRALHPELPIRPGFVSYRMGFAPGTTRNVFTVVTSLVPGTVPSDEDGDLVVYHCLDVEQPVAAQLAAEEAALSTLLGRPAPHA